MRTRPNPETCPDGCLHTCRDCDGYLTEMEHTHFCKTHSREFTDDGEWSSDVIEW